MPSGELPEHDLKMGKDKSKNRDATKAGRSSSEKNYIGVLELKGYYFGHGDHGSGTRFNKTVEKIVEYCRVEVCVLMCRSKSNFHCK